MYREQNRAFSYAVLTSVVLHGALLWGVSPNPRPLLAEVELGPLVARLVDPPAPAPAAAPPAPPKAQPEKREPRRARTAPAAKPVAEAPPAPVIEPPSPPAPAPEPALPQTVEPVAPAPPVTARAEPSPVPAEAPAARAAPSPIDPAASVARYRLQLIGAARKYKRYPRLAMENNWEGDVVVRMAFGGNGLLAGLTVQSSSGYSVLDRQALEMFRHAAKTIEVPPALRGREFSFEVRAIYNLRDQDSG